MLFCFLFCVSAFSQEAEKIDEFGNIYCDDYLARMDSVFNVLKDNPNSKIYVLVYEGRLKKAISDNKYNIIGYRYVLPRFGEAKTRIKTIKKRIALYKQPSENFIFIEGGLREKFTVEFWLVRNDSIPPKPMPTLKKMKYQKGRPSGFCISM